MEKKRKIMDRIHSFLTKLTLKTAVGVFKVFSFLKAVPFALESNDTLSVKKFESRWRLWLWHFVKWLFYFAAAFQF